MTRGARCCLIAPVAKYDAFGREIGEDTLGGLGSGASEDAAPVSDVSEDGFAGLDSGATAEPAPAAPAPSPLRVEPQAYTPPPQPQPQPQPHAQRPSITIPLHPQRRRRSGRGVFVVLFVIFIFIATLVVGAVAIFNTVDDATEAVRVGIEDSLKVAPVNPAKPAVAPKGIAGRSLVRKANFAAALAKLRSSELRLTHLRLAPERIDVQLLTRGGRLRSQQVQPGGAIKQFGSDSGPGFDQTRTIPFARLKPGAPQRLARRGAAKLGVRVSTLQYLVPTLFSGRITWVAYFKRGRYVLGDAAGRYQRSYP